MGRWRVGVVVRPCHPFQLFLSRSVYKQRLQRLVEDIVVKCALKMQFLLTESCRSFLTVSKLDVFTYSSINYIVISKEIKNCSANLLALTFVFMLTLLCITEKSGKEVMSKGSSGMEVILASLEVSSQTTLEFLCISIVTDLLKRAFCQSKWSIMFKKFIIKAFKKILLSYSHVYNIVLRIYISEHIIKKVALLFCKNKKP